MAKQKEKRIEKHDVVGDVTYSYSSDWIHELESKSHWQLYWEQQSMMRPFVKPGDKVLEVGLGSGFCANYLRSKGVEVTTVDIDADKKPDIVANLVTYEPEEEYDHLLAFEVFEHIPYEHFLDILRKFKSKCSNVFISVPLNKVKLMYADLSLPVLKNVSFSIGLPKFKITESHHFWEINYGEFKEKRVFNDFAELGYRSSSRKEVQTRLFFALHTD